MTVEIIQAIGQWVVIPICITALVVYFLYKALEV